MKKKLLSAMLAVSMIFSAIPAYAASDKGMKTGCKTVKVIELKGELEKAPSNSIPVQDNIDADGGDYQVFANKLCAPLVSALDGDYATGAKSASASGAKLAGVKIKAPKKAKSLKIENRYYNEVEFSFKPSGEPVRYFACLFSEVNKKTAKVNKTKNALLGPCEFMAEISAPISTGSLYSVTNSTYAGIIPGSTWYLGILTFNGYTMSITGLKKVVIPDKPFMQVGDKIKIKQCWKQNWLGVYVSRWTEVTANVYNKPPTAGMIKFGGKYTYLDNGIIKRDGKCKLRTYTSSTATYPASELTSNSTVKPNTIKDIKYKCNGWPTIGNYYRMDIMYEGGHWVMP